MKDEDKLESGTSAPAGAPQSEGSSKGEVAPVIDAAGPHRGGPADARDPDESPPLSDPQVRADSDSDVHPPRSADARISADTQMPNTTPPRRRVRRFSWPMRLFLGFLLFDMVARSIITLTPFDKDWVTDLDVPKFPKRLPTPEDLKKIEQGKDPAYATASERYWATFTSVLEFANPFPEERTRKRLSDVESYAKYAVVWVGTRLSFFGAVSGVDQNWPMFSPNVRQTRTVPRAKLIFEDGSSEQLWLLGEPWDVTDFSRWLIKRPLQIDLRLDEDYDARLGVSRHLVHTFPYSRSGSPLRYVEFYRVAYRLPQPGEDAYKVLASQNRKKLTEPFWRYDVSTRKGETLQDDKDRAKKEREKKKKAEKQAAKAGPKSVPAPAGTAASASAAVLGKSATSEQVASPEQAAAANAAKNAAKNAEHAAKSREQGANPAQGVSSERGAQPEQSASPEPSVEEQAGQEP